MINFTPFTSLVEEKDNHTIPLHKFTLHNLDRLEEQNNKRDYLIDIIGWLTGVGEIPSGGQVGCQSTDIRRLHVEDTSLNKVEVTLWSRESNLITRNIVKEQQGPKTVVITALTVKNYNGK